MFARLSFKGLIAVILWGASFIATAIALRALEPFTLVAIRMWMGFLLLTLLQRTRGEKALPLPTDRPMCLALGLVLTVHLLVQAYGLQRTSAIHTGWIIGAIPVGVALGAQWLGQQRLHPFGWLGVAIGAGGVAIVTAFKPAEFAQARIGDLLQVVSVLTWTIYTLAAAGPLARSGALHVTTSSMGVTALVTTVIAAGLALGHVHSGVPAVASGAGLTATAPVLSVSALSDWKVIVAVLFLGILCSGVAYYLWFAATHEHGPTRVGALLYLEPIVTLVCANRILHEAITLNAIIGGLFVLAGVWLVAHGTARAANAPPSDMLTPAE
jgi:drug/metabolite transporter (DMT)-like permease